MNKGLVGVLFLSVALAGCGGSGDDAGIVSLDEGVKSVEIVPLENVKINTNLNDPLIVEYDAIYGLAQIYGEKSESEYNITSHRYVVGENTIEVQKTEKGVILSSPELEISLSLSSNGAVLNDSKNSLSISLTNDDLMALGLSESVLSNVQNGAVQVSSRATGKKGMGMSSDFDINQHFSVDVSQCSSPFDGRVTASLPSGVMMGSLPLTKLGNGFTYVSTSPLNMDEQLWKDATYRISNLSDKESSGLSDCGLIGSALNSRLKKMESKVAQIAKDQPEKYSALAKKLAENDQSEMFQKRSNLYMMSTAFLGYIQKIKSATDYAGENDTEQRLRSLLAVYAPLDILQCATKGTEYDLISKGINTSAILWDTVLGKIMGEIGELTGAGPSDRTVMIRLNFVKDAFRPKPVEINFNPGLPREHVALECRPEIDLETPPRSIVETQHDIMLKTFWADQAKARVTITNTRDTSVPDDAEGQYSSEVILSNTYPISESNEDIKLSVAAPSEPQEQIVMVELLDENNTVVDSEMASISIIPPKPIVAECGSVSSVENGMTHADATDFCGSMGKELIGKDSVDAYRADIKQCMGSAWIWLKEGGASTSWGYSAPSGLMTVWGNWREFGTVCVDK